MYITTVDDMTSIAFFLTAVTYGPIFHFSPVYISFCSLPELKMFLVDAAEVCAARNTHFNTPLALYPSLVLQEIPQTQFTTINYFIESCKEI